MQIKIAYQKNWLSRFCWLPAKLSYKIYVFWLVDCFILLSENDFLTKFSAKQLYEIGPIWSQFCSNCHRLLTPTEDEGLSGTQIRNIVLGVLISVKVCLFVCWACFRYNRNAEAAEVEVVTAETTGNQYQSVNQNEVKNNTKTVFISYLHLRPCRDSIKPCTYSIIVAFL